MAKSPIQKFLDAGVQFTDLSRKQAEGLVRSLVKSGDVRRKDAEQMVQTLVDRGRDTTERIASMVQQEVARQFAAFSEQFDELEDKIEAIADHLTKAAERSATESTARLD